MNIFRVPRLACVVEGDGDEAAVPILVRRIIAEIAPTAYIECPKPVRMPRDKLLRSPHELERALLYARLQTGDRGAILVMIDSDGEPPCQVGPELLGRARQTVTDLEVGVVLAHREFEAWFLAAAESLRGHRDLPADLTGPLDPEAVADAKGWLRERMPPGRRYRETKDQPALAAAFDLQAARRSHSFDKCYREVERLVRALVGTPDAD